MRYAIGITLLLVTVLSFESTEIMSSIDMESEAFPVRWNDDCSCVSLSPVSCVFLGGESVSQQIVCHLLYFGGGSLLSSHSSMMGSSTKSCQKVRKMNPNIPPTGRIHHLRRRVYPCSVEKIISQNRIKNLAVRLDIAI